MDSLIFNELSYPFKDKYEANSKIEIFIRTFAAAARLGLNRLRLQKNIGDNLHHLELAPGYYVSQWLQPGGDRSKDDLKERFRDIMTGAPLITDNEPIEKEENERSSFEISIPGEEPKEAEGLGAAYLLDSIALSFLSIAFWDNVKIEKLKHYFIKEDGSDSVEIADVRHASRPEHMEKHLQWIEEKKVQSLEASRDLWNRRKEFFPDLILCGSVEQQLTTTFGIRSRYFNQIIDRLKQLDAFAKEWTTGSFNDKKLKEYGLNVSGEHEKTMTKYGRERRFRLPGGGKAYFEKHIKTGELRFHFLPDEKNHRIYVGYIGPHLRTVSN